MKCDGKELPLGAYRTMSRLEIGDKLIYGSQGIMTLTDKRYESIGDEQKLYYVLSGEDTATAALTFVPVDSERLSALMKPLLSKDELLAALSGFDKEKFPEWNESSRARQEYFKKILEGDSRTDVLGMIYLIRESGRRRVAEGKKNFLSDENLLKRAEKILSSEISLVFGIGEDEALEMINRAVE